MEEFVSVEPEDSHSPSPISEPPDITNWFSSYVYESFPSCSLVKESESELYELPIEKNKENLGVSHKIMHKSMNQISDRNLCESLPSEPPDIGNWFSSYVYKSQMLDTGDGLEFSVPRVSETIKETETEKEKIHRNNVCPKLFEQELVSSPKVTDFSQSHSLLSEPLDVRNWFSSYEYQSPQLSDTHELRFSSFEKDQLIIEESDTEEENSFGIFRKIESKQQTIPNDYKENIAVDTVKEVSSDNAYSDQEMEKKSSVGLFNVSKQESIFKHESLFCEPKQEPRYSQKPLIPSKIEDSLHELRPKYIQETIPMNSNRENQESIVQELDDKENVHRKSTETGFVTTKKVTERCSIAMSRPNTEVLLGCSRSRALKNVVEEENKEERKKKRRVLGEMSNHQFPKAEEIAGKWSCPQKHKGNSARPLKQLRLSTWIHKL